MARLAVGDELRQARGVKVEEALEHLDAARAGASAMASVSRCSSDASRASTGLMT